MALTQKDIDSLEKAIATGAEQVRIGDRDVRYRNLNDMERTLARAKREVQSRTRTRQIRVTSTKGLE